MDILHLSFLGRFECIHQNIPITQFRSDKIRALLVYLAFEADRPHRRETLATLFWPNSPHRSALSNLRKSLHRLRQTLDAQEDGLSAAVLTITRQSVQLNQTAVSLDAAQFEETLKQITAHSHHSLDNCSICLQQLENAVTLYQGELLAGFSLPDTLVFEEWLLVKREFLHQLALNALHNLTSAYEKQREYSQAYIYALRQTALEPWREEAHRQLMRILAHQGERSRALAQYELCRQLLQAELGVSPSPKTTALYTQIEQGLFPDAGAETAVSLHHFPTQFTSFIGRDDEITAVSKQLLNPDCRLLTLIGPGGIGKTRLSLEAVQYTFDHHSRCVQTLFTEGAYFVPLVSATSTDQLITALGKALQLTFQATETAEQQLLNYLSNKKTVLVLDNFEQLVAETAVFMTHLLQTAPNVQLLITSREALQLRAEWQLRIDGLSYPPKQSQDSKPLPTDLQTYGALRLFMQAARRIQPTFQPNQADLVAISHICQLTQGVPLAIEIAAAWVRIMDCPTIASQIMHNVDFLKTTLRDTPERHRSMRVVFEQSWHYLSTTAQATLAQISLFQNGFTLEAALAVMDDAIAELAGLLDKSLLRRDGNGRYQIHELLRQFAAEKLEIGNPEAIQQARRRYSLYYLHFIADYKDIFTQSETAVRWDVAQVEIDNIRQAWEWAVAHKQWDALATAADGLSLFYQTQSLFQEGVEVFNITALQIEKDIEKGGRETAPAPSRGQAVYALNRLRLCQIQILLIQSLYPEAAQLAQTTIHSCRQSGNDTQLAAALINLGHANWKLGEFDKADKHLSEGLTLAKKSNLPQQTAYALHCLGNIAVGQRKGDVAHTLLQEAITLYEESGNLRELATALADFGSANIINEQPISAQLYYRRSATLHQKINNPAGALDPLNSLCFLALEQGDYKTIEQCGKEMSLLIKKSGSNWLRSRLTTYLGHIALMQRDYATALQRFSSSLTITSDFYDKMSISYGLTAMIAAMGNMPLAAQLFYVTDPAQIYNPFAMKFYELLYNAIRTSLTDEEWETAVSLGNNTTLDERLSLAIAFVKH